ncbi:unnamed protein product [Pleuronectes platessa]|uniref:Uncharacterized protein n=1 Tax=Pleuronectes platessa TaxID=8262 RepID=A0A9N7VT64_PLEPL|nr:unnamed protein product [Pleuronectes platessa]
MLAAAQPQTSQTVSEGRRGHEHDSNREGPVRPRGPHRARSVNRVIWPVRSHMIRGLQRRGRGAGTEAWRFSSES